ncbi:MAG: hypothetical protein UY05_C0006G0002 [Candidatus Peregrinibacteria bacterium GW2011_GWA2_47_7]|nr:MAG: hypothetical protein UY05_C0006G0002 [Candidatus Peregrinibacteria bacterium GW2011_GWA2_47_7]
MMLNLNVNADPGGSLPLNVIGSHSPAMVLNHFTMTSKNTPLPQLIRAFMRNYAILFLVR